MGKCSRRKRRRPSTSCCGMERRVYLAALRLAEPLHGRARRVLEVAFTALPLGLIRVRRMGGALGHALLGGLPLLFQDFARPLRRSSDRAEGFGGGGFDGDRRVPEE